MLRSVCAHLARSASARPIDGERACVAPSAVTAPSVQAPASCVTPTMRKEMFEQGYTIVDGMVTAELLERLIAAARRCVQEAYESDDVNLHGGWVGKEPGDKGPNALRGVMMPGWRAPEFAEYMGSELVLDYVRGFLNVEKEELMMPDADCILYCGHKAGKDRAQGWHRDSGEYLRKGYDEQSQREQWEVLQSPEYWPQVGPYGGPFDPEVSGSGGLFGHSTYIENNPGAQWCRWETALVDHEVNSGVEYVAGSHRRWRTDLENDILLPESKKRELEGYVRVLPDGVSSTGMSGGRNGQHSGESILPGAAVVQIKSGQTVFWNGNGMHRGRTTGGVERISLAGGWAGPPPGGWAAFEPTPEQQDQDSASIIQWKLNPGINTAALCAFPPADGQAARRARTDCHCARLCSIPRAPPFRVDEDIVGPVAHAPGQQDAATRIRCVDGSLAVHRNGRGGLCAAGRRRSGGVGPAVMHRSNLTHTRRHGWLARDLNRGHG